MRTLLIFACLAAPLAAQPPAPKVVPPALQDKPKVKVPGYAPIPCRDLPS